MLLQCVDKGAVLPSQPQAGEPAPSLSGQDLVHELLHLLHGVVSLQGQREHSHLLLLFLRPRAGLLLLGLRGRGERLQPSRAVGMCVSGTHKLEHAAHCPASPAHRPWVCSPEAGRCPNLRCHKCWGRGQGSRCPRCRVSSPGLHSDPSSPALSPRQWPSASPNFPNTSRSDN